jgi:hypothetical protein
MYSRHRFPGEIISLYVGDRLVTVQAFGESGIS